MNACGLDFGTSNSAVALPDGQVLPLDVTALEPRLFRSVLFFPEDTREVLAGATAIERYLDDSAGRFLQSMKTWLPSASFHVTQIRGTAYALEELIAYVLRILREVGSRHAGAPLDAVVLGRPAVFSPDPVTDALAQRRLQTAAERAGFRDIRFVIEPIAAALAYEERLSQEELVLVADFGAGTSDLTLMRLGPNRRGRADRRSDVVGSAGVYVGGDRFDAAIMKHKLLPYFGAGTSYLLQHRRLDIPQHLQGKLLSWHEMSLIRERSTQELLQQMMKTGSNVPAIQALHDLVMYNLGYRLFRAIEACKVKLSSSDEAMVDFDEECIHIHERVTRAEFESFSQPLLDALDRCVTELFLKVGEVGEIDAVFLTGGSSQIPAVHALFARRFGESRLRTADVFTSVAEGLGRAAATW